MTVVVFAGPSIYGVPPKGLQGLMVLPPAACGDVARAVRDGATTVALIDGLFETAASVWHKELLWALSKGVRVFGPSSIGALRAAEMWPFGMQGVGLVYRLYRCRSIIDDDEVALLHGPPDVGCIPVTEAMVNVRMTLRRARQRALITPAAEQAINRVAKSMFYKDRTLARVFELANEQPGGELCNAELLHEIEQIRRDVKREDAMALLSLLGSLPKYALVETKVEFTRTRFWNDFEQKHVLTRRR